MKLSGVISLLSVALVGVHATNGGGTLTVSSVSSSLAGGPATLGHVGATAVPTSAIASCLVLVSATGSVSPTTAAFNSTPVISSEGSVVTVPTTTSITARNNGENSSPIAITSSSPQTLTTFMATVYPTTSGQYVTVYPTHIAGNSATIPICGDLPSSVLGGTNTIPTSSDSSDSPQTTGTQLPANAGSGSVGSSAGTLELSMKGLVLGTFAVLGMVAL